MASLSAKLVVALGTKRVATPGMLLFAAGLAVAATVGVDTGYGRLAVAFVLMGAGMGLAGAPATESIMNSLPPARANIGSAVNDTTRELGVAVVGSIMSSLYAAQLPADAPDSLGAAVRSAARWRTRGGRRRYLPSLPRTLDHRADELHRIGAPDAVRGE